MSCKKVMDQMVLYLDKELDSVQMEEFLYHIRNCDKCGKEFEKTNYIINGLRDFPTLELPENYHEELMAKIKELDGECLVSKKSNISYFRKMNIAAVFLLCIVIAGVVGKFNSEAIDNPYQDSVNADNRIMGNKVVAQNTSGVDKEGIQGFSASTDLDFQDIINENIEPMTEDKGQESEESFEESLISQIETYDLPDDEIEINTNDAPLPIPRAMNGGQIEYEYRLITVEIYEGTSESLINELKSVILTEEIYLVENDDANYFSEDGKEIVKLKIVSFGYDTAKEHLSKIGKIISTDD